MRPAPVPKSEPPPLNVSPRSSSAKLAEETPDPAPPETKKRSSAAPKEDAPTPLPPGFLVRKADPNVFEKEPCLRDISFPADVLEALRRKLRACSDVVFDFRAADLYLEQKEQKKQTLMEVLDYINNSERKPVPLEQIIEELIEMISANIFRPLPPPSTSVSSLLLNDPEELEPMMEVAWPHLQLIYEILLRLVMCSEINPKVAKKHIDHCFVLKVSRGFSLISQQMSRSAFGSVCFGRSSRKRLSKDDNAQSLRQDNGVASLHPQSYSARLLSVHS